MSSRAPDIVELEELLNNGEGDDLLCAKAIKIIERIRREIEVAKRKGYKTSLNLLQQQLDDFQDVVNEIHRRRHDGALNAFKEYLDAHRISVSA